MIKIDNEKAIMRFGKGDIGINTYVRLDIDENGLIFYNQEKRTIGEMADLRAGKYTDNIDDYPVKMVFDKVESIDVVIEQLQALKIVMINDKGSIEHIYKALGGDIMKQVICVDDDCCGDLIEGQIYNVIKVVNDKYGERYVLKEIEGEYSTSYLEDL